MCVCVLGDGDKGVGGFVQAAGFGVAGNHSGECTGHDEKACKVLAKDRSVAFPPFSSFLSPSLPLLPLKLLTLPLHTPVTYTHTHTHSDTGTAVYAGGE